MAAATAALRPGEYVTEHGLTGRIKWYDKAKGIGRINADDGREGMHFHYSGLQIPTSHELLPGDPVRFDVAAGDPRGPKCVNIELQRVDFAQHL
jgi:cold shock CspA family protein